MTLLTGSHDELLVLSCRFLSISYTVVASVPVPVIVVVRLAVVVIAVAVVVLLPVRVVRTSTTTAPSGICGSRWIVVVTLSVTVISKVVVGWIRETVASDGL